LCLRFL
jgi:hypothetical protein